jgi:hypothetical protein
MPSVAVATSFAETSVATTADVAVLRLRTSKEAGIPIHGSMLDASVICREARVYNKPKWGLRREDTLTLGKEVPLARSGVEGWKAGPKVFVDEDAGAGAGTAPLAEGPEKL